MRPLEREIDRVTGIDAVQFDRLSARIGEAE